MSDLGDLYQSVLLEHSRSPRNQGALPGANRTAEGYNPLCGDRVTLWLRVDGDRVMEARFVGEGCAISRASASLLTGMVKGKTRSEAEELGERVQRLVTGHASEGDAAALGRLAALGGVARFPGRVKCATMAWHALRVALAAGGTMQAADAAAPDGATRG